MTHYVPEQSATHFESYVGYQTKREKSPPDSAIKRWRRKGRAVWARKGGHRLGKLRRINRTKEGLAQTGKSFFSRSVQSD